MNEPKKMPLPEQIVQPQAKRNGLVLTILGGSLFILTLSLNAIFSEFPMAFLLAGTGFALVTLALGIGKLIEPPASLLMNPRHIVYHHRKGQLQLSWDNILRFDVPRIQRGLNSVEIPVIGFKVHNYDDVLAHIDKRMAVHILLEQRQLMVVALRSQFPDLEDYTSYFDVPSRFKTESGTIYDGVLASFAQRMQHMRELLGYDLFISENALDRPSHEFIALLHELQRTRQSYLTDQHTD